MRPRPILLNGVEIGHWDEHGRWVRNQDAVPYPKELSDIDRQIIVVGWGSSKPRPARNEDLRSW